MSNLSGKEEFSQEKKVNQRKDCLELIQTKGSVMTSEKTEIVVVGGGPAGLVCAGSLIEAGHQVLLLEADSRLGGRLKTDRHEGFLLDRGFQVLQKAYPAARELLDYPRLDLKSYPAGARVRANNRFAVLADPLRHPGYLWPTLTAGICTFADRVRLLRLAYQVSRGPVEELFAGPETMARDFLVNYGFSSKMIDHFFTPFLAGICLDPEIQVTDRFLLFVLRMFAQGDVAVPAQGMEEIPKQLAEKIPAENILLDAPVHSLVGTTAILGDGRRITAEALVIATPAPETVRLLDLPALTESCREICFYFSADQPPIDDALLILNGEGQGLINSVMLPSLVSPAYAPPDKTLIAVVVPGVQRASLTDLEQTVRDELATWFGAQVFSWKILKSYDIRHALTRPVPPTANPFQINHDLGDGRFVCGEYSNLPSIQWSMLSGQITAKQVSSSLSGR